MDDPDARTLKELVSELGLTVDPATPEAQTQFTPPPVLSDLPGLVHRTHLGRYPITGRLGAGGMGEVLQVVDPEVGRQMAAKVVLGATDRQRLAKFILEAQVTGQLEHPNIVPLHELGMTDEGQIYFTMKRIEGRTLEAVLRGAEEGGASNESDRRLALDAGAQRLVPLLQIFIKVCDALAFAHSRGVIHRDLKPENVMVGRFGEVMVCDWGLAKVLGRPDLAAGGLRLAVGGGRLAELARGGGGEPLKTLDGTVCGTPQYMPPEQARGEIDKLDARSDVYALGAMLYRMLAGRPAYEGDSSHVILHRLVQGPPQPPSQAAPEREIPWDLEIAVNKAMERQRALRYQSVVELKHDLEAWIEGRLVLAADYTAWQTLKKWATRNRAAVRAAAGILLALVLGFVGIGYQLAQANRERLKAQQAERKAQQEKRKAQNQERAAHRERKKAQQAERSAQQEKRKADEQRDLALASKADFDRLADVQHHRRLLAEANRLWPRRPALIGAYQAWLARAARLTSRLPSHRKTVARLKARPELDAAGQVLLSALEKLVADLQALDGTERQGNTIAGMRSRLAFARRLAEREAADGAAWARAIAAIARAQAYRGLAVRRVPGLAPLGPDPTTGLWEFAHLGSGIPAARDGQGKLQTGETTGLVLVLLPPGRFKLGASRTAGSNKDPQAEDDEQPVREVTLAAFYLSKYEMTQGQWQRAIGENPSMYVAGTQFGPQLASLRNPVPNVGWDQCSEVLRRLGLVLPSEAQWEYAARAGTQTIWPYGDRVADLQGKANLADSTAKQYAPAWTCETRLTDGHVVHAPVGLFPPNRWGLFDMTGNVWEWCRDRYGSYALRVRPADGLRAAPASARLRVARGGSFYDTPTNARCAYRDRNAPAFRSNTLGLRPALGAQVR